MVGSLSPGSRWFHATAGAVRKGSTLHRFVVCKMSREGWRMRITDIIWKEAIVEKLTGKHDVSIAEAEEVLLLKPVVRRMVKGRVRGEDVYAAMAQIAGGRYLIVFFIDKRRGVALPISARDMGPAERKYYAKRRQTP